ncbi:MAG: TonB-dependent receptor [Acidobacteria bacterium]|nr:TonB-dependent receptor [Acidobacteriota bacterium]
MVYSCFRGVRISYPTNLACVRYCLLLLLWISVFTQPQSRADDLDWAAVEGRLTDRNGDAIPGAVVKVRLVETGIQRSTSSDARGWYRVSSLPAGKCEIEIEASGFRRVLRTGQNAVAGWTLRLDCRLEVAPIEVSVEVRPEDGSAPESLRTAVGLSFDERDVLNLPILNRDPMEMVFLLSNVQLEPFEIRDLAEPGTRDVISQPPQEAGLFTLSGGRAYSNNLTIDGFDNNDDRLARERMRLTMEAVEEVQVISSQFSAEYGRASGGRVNIRTRGGRIDWHGSATARFQDESLNANSFFRNLRGQPRRSYQRRQYAGSLGGTVPGMGRRLFFFSAAERREEPDSDAIFALIPADRRLNPAYPLREAPTGRPFIRDGVSVGLFEDELETPGTANVFTGRIDGATSTASQFMFRWDEMRTHHLRARDQGSTLASGILQRRRDSTAQAIQHVWTLRPRWVNVIRFQHSLLSPRSLPEETRPGVIVGSSRGLSFGSLAFLSGFVTGVNGFPETRSERRYQGSGSVDGQLGRHRLKFGLEVTYLDVRTSSLNLFQGFYNFPSFGDFRDHAPSRFRQRIGQSQQALINRVAGAFLQNDWRVRPGLTLSGGLRYDLESLLRRERNNWGPRLAIAWDPIGTGNAVIRVGGGIFYNRILLRTFEDYALNSRIFEIDLGAGSGSTSPLTALSRIGGFPNLFPNDPGDARVRDLLRPVEALRSLSPRLRIPYSLQASLGTERRWGRDVRIEAGYVVHRALGLWRDRNLNAPIPPTGGFVEFLLRPPAGTPGVIVLPDGTTAFINAAREIVDIGIPLVRFDLSEVRYRDTGSGNQRTRIFGLNGQPGSAETTDPIQAAVRAMRNLRPDPSSGEVEQIQSDGQSSYHALNILLTWRWSRVGSLRVSYTLSKLIDNGVLNTSSPMDEFDLRLDRSLGITDARHRLVMHGMFQTPRWLGGIELAPVIQFMSGRPYNITSNGQDRNLNDTLTDRLHFNGRSSLGWIRPGDTAGSTSMAARFAFPTIGSNGSLGRNTATGPGIKRLDLRVSRRIAFARIWRIRAFMDIYNLTNTPNFIMNGFYGPLDTREGVSVFMQPRATRRPRNVELGLRVEF